MRTGKPSDRATVIGAFAAVEPDLQAQFPTMLYPELLARVHMVLDARLRDTEPPPAAVRPASSSSSGSTSADTGTQTGVKSETEAEAFARSVASWPPFPDTVAALAALSQRYKLVILSNIDRATIAETRKLMERPGGFAFDAVYTAEEVGAYKPAPEMLSHALARLKEDFGIEQGEVLMTAQSVFHDILPAKQRGLGTAWINRAGAITGLPEGVSGEEAMFVFPTMGAMAGAVEKAFSQ